MRNKIISLLCIAAGLGCNSFSTTASPHYELNTVYEVECTAYADQGTTATLTHIDSNTKRYVCAFAPEYFGKVIAVSTDFDGDGEDETRLYEVEDTGSVSAGVRSGEVIDLFFPEGEEACFEFGRRTVRIVIYERGLG